MTTIADAGNTGLFRSHLEHVLDRAGPGLGAARVHAALSSVDLKEISSGERNVLLNLAGSLSADGYVSHTDADALVSLIHGYATPDSSFTPAGMHTAPIRMPTTDQVGSYPGSSIFADLFSRLVHQAVETLRNAAFLGSAANLLMHTDEGTQAQRIAQALNDADLSRFTPGDRRFVLSMIGFATADGHVNRAEANAIVDYIRFASGQASGVTAQPWQVQSTDGKLAHIDLGKYTLDIDQSDSQFVLTNKANGETTRISGDPHFDNDGKRIGTFKGTLTLCLDDGTKLTINTVPAGNGELYSSKLTITQGDQALVVDHLNQNSGQPLSITTSGVLGRELDWATDDGTRVYEDVATRQWVRLDPSGWTQPIDGDFLSHV
jgi:hypothetical protein